MFTDNVEITFTAGKGGNGIVAWRREKYVPKGGPYGGNGGKGASVVFKVDYHLLSLENFRGKKTISAENGKSGGPNNRMGKTAKDLIINIPLGTILIDSDTKEIIFEFMKKEDEFLLCKGGFGGKGNTHFKSSTNQAPNTCTEGKKGQFKNILLELKLIADIGLVGMPNAGKSTLMKNLTKSKVKIAPYPFTTLTPNLGVIEFEDFTQILLADIPGIIPDAHINKGLGLSFLKHIERTNILMYVIDISALERNDPFNDFQILQNEIKNYNPKIFEKPHLVILNKIDQPCSEHIQNFKDQYPYSKDNIFEVSALEKTGLAKLKRKIQTLS